MWPFRWAFVKIKASFYMTSSPRSICISLFSLALCTLFLASCATTPRSFNGFWRDGSSQIELQRDQTTCEVTALREVPRAMATAQTPTYTTPTYTTPQHTSCYGYGYSASCTTTGGQTYGGTTTGGQIYSYDANRDLRGAVEEQCMASKGYFLTSIPACSKDQIDEGIVLPRGNTLPARSEVKCITESGYVPL